MPSEYLKYIAEGVAICAGLFSVAGLVGYTLAQFWNSKKDKRKDDIETENTLTTYLKNQIEGFKNIAKEQDTKIQTMDKQLAEFKAVIGEKDKTIERYLQILQNRNPELENFIKQSTEYQKSSTQAFGAITKVLTEMSENLQKDLTIKATIGH